jgi:pimeloyl-ACP methyl ester carboxylesterase
MTHIRSSTLFVQGPDGPLAVQRWGDAGKPLVVLVHGYPDNRHMWDPVALELARCFQVVAYDVRGAGASFKPTRRADYTLARLQADFTAVINAVSPTQPVHLAAHDWGSVQSWEFVTAPELKGRIASFTSCSGPSLDHVALWMRARLRRPSLKGLGQVIGQMLRSWYVFFFQLPWLPDALWRNVLGPHWPRLMRLLEATTIQPRATQAQDGALGLNLYRANFFPRVLHPRERHAHAPVQVLVLTKDHFLSPALNDDLARWVPDLTRKEIKAGHWLTIRQPQVFAQAVIAHIDRVEAQEAQSASAQRAAGSAS